MLQEKASGGGVQVVPWSKWVIEPFVLCKGSQLLTEGGEVNNNVLMLLLLNALPYRKTSNVHQMLLLCSR
jgi:hypothetical protein